MKDEKLLEAKKINKQYPGVQALEDVDFDLYQGEVHGLVGQNGAGKSTFIEIIAGTVKPNSGEIVINGDTFSSLQPSEAIDLGIQTVHQATQLVDGLSVSENIFLHDIPCKQGIVKYNKCHRDASQILDFLDIDISPDKKVGDLTFIEKKLVSLAKASSRRAKILILDEPTASLDKDGKEILFNQIRTQTEKNNSVIYISHHIKEIFEICDRVTVLKDGEKIGTYNVSDIKQTTLINKMIGEKKTTIYEREHDYIDESAETLEIKDYHQEGVVNHISFDVKKGEIFGLGGLVGSGRTELAQLIVGIEEKDSGTLIYGGEEITPVSPQDSIQKNIGYLTEDRKSTGLILKRPVDENISLIKLTKNMPFLVDLNQEQKDTSEMIDKLDIKTPSQKQLVKNLSGGNQQKVVLAKWLLARANIIIFDEPTVGIDVGAKKEIYKLMDDLASEGKTILMISSDSRELISICDRIGVMRKGELKVILEGKEKNQENLLNYIMGIK